jgi:ATP-dependent Clp protease adaptor protein ClpS
MAEQQAATETPSAPPASGGGTATKARPSPAPPKVDRLPPWKVLLHNDDHNSMPYVVQTIIELTKVNRYYAMLRMIEAHTSGVAQLLTTHREHAELLREQFASRKLIATTEPA